MQHLDNQIKIFYQKFSQKPIPHLTKSKNSAIKCGFLGILPQKNFFQKNYKKLLTNLQIAIILYLSKLLQNFNESCFGFATRNSTKKGFRQNFRQNLPKTSVYSNRPTGRKSVFRT